MHIIKTFYHGTSDVFEICKMILPPNETGNLREDWRKKNLDKVYFTISQLSAEMYAKKACKKYGGNPVIYIVKPMGLWYHRVDTEYVAERALVIKELEGVFDKKSKGDEEKCQKEH